MRIQIDRKPMARFALAFAISVAVGMVLLLAAPPRIRLSFSDIASHIILILACYLFGVLAISLWRGWVRIGG